MCKKLVIVAVAVVAVALLLRKTEVGSHVRLAWKNYKSDIKKQVPLETEIERLRLELTRLSDDKRDVSSIAEEMVAIDNLKSDITRKQANLEKQKVRIMKMKADLETGQSYIVYGDTRWSAATVKAQLGSEFANYKLLEDELKANEKTLQAREMSLTQAREQLAAKQSARRELEVELARLEAELKTVRLAETRSRVVIDDSELARIKKSVNELNTRIKVEQKKLVLQGEFVNGPIPVTQPEPRKDVMQEIDQYFNNNAAQAPKK